MITSGRMSSVRVLQPSIMDLCSVLDLFEIRSLIADWSVTFEIRIGTKSTGKQIERIIDSTGKQKKRI